MSLHDMDYSTGTFPSELSEPEVAAEPRPLSEFSVAIELSNICDRVRGHVGSGMERSAAIEWVVESQMAAADAEHPEFLHFLRGRNLVNQ